MNEVESGRLSHAYLFTGSRGTGKTTCAKILSKAVNCLHPVNGSPCNECAICRGIDDGSILDVTEIDAASNNGVDNIRDLREEANFTPAAAKYRVYIIDEVHMLSSGAFNALLKTLEEPPEHVLFILATTEVHKIPATILSRCQRFDFRRIAPEDISARLLTVAENEGIALDKDAALLIARVADGALRDALSLLDQCAGTNEKVTLETVGACAGLLGREYLFDLSDAIISGNTEAVLEITDKLHSSSCDTERLLSELVNHFRNVMIAKTAKQPENFIVCTPDECKRYKQTAANVTYGTILHIMEALCKESSVVKYSAHRRAQVETLLIRLCDPSLSTDNAAIIRRLDELEAQLMSLKANGAVLQNTAPAPEKEPVKAIDTAPRFEAPAAAAPEPKPETGRVKTDNIETESAKTELQSNSPLQNAAEPAEKADVKQQNPNNDAAFAVQQPKSQPSANNTESDEIDKAMPFTAWENTLKQLSSVSKPLYAILLGSTAYRAGNSVFIKAKNTAFNMMFDSPDHKSDIAEALVRATGEKLIPMIYREGSSPLAQETADPLDSLIAKLNKLKIDFIVEE